MPPDTDQDTLSSPSERVGRRPSPIRGRRQPSSSHQPPAVLPPPGPLLWPGGRFLLPLRASAARHPATSVSRALRSNICETSNHDMDTIEYAIPDGARFVGVALRNRRGGPHERR